MVILSLLNLTFSFAIDFFLKEKPGLKKKPVGYATLLKADGLGKNFN